VYGLRWQRGELLPGFTKRVLLFVIINLYNGPFFVIILPRLASHGGQTGHRLQDTVLILCMAQQATITTGSKGYWILSQRALWGEAAASLLSHAGVKVKQPAICWEKADPDLLSAWSRGQLPLCLVTWPHPGPGRGEGDSRVEERHILIRLCLLGVLQTYFHCNSLVRGAGEGGLSLMEDPGDAATKFR
jgi:hypothetical protein